MDATETAFLDQYTVHHALADADLNRTAVAGTNCGEVYIYSTVAGGALGGPGDDCVSQPMQIFCILSAWSRRYGNQLWCVDGGLAPTDLRRCGRLVGGADNADRAMPEGVQVSALVLAIVIASNGYWRFDEFDPTSSARTTEVIQL